MNWQAIIIIDLCDSNQRKLLCALKRTRPEIDVESFLANKSFFLV